MDKQTPNSYVAEDNDRLVILHRSKEKWDTHTNRILFVDRLISFCASLVSLRLMANTIFVFQTTQTLNVWPQQPITWPHYMMIATQSIGTVMSAGIIVAYCCGRRHADRAVKVGGYVMKAESGISLVMQHSQYVNVIIVAISAGLFGFSMNNIPDSLSPAACDVNVASDSQQKSFDTVCNSGSVTEYLQYAHTGIQIFTIIVAMIMKTAMWRKSKLEAQLVSEKSQQMETQLQSQYRIAHFPQCNCACPTEAQMHEPYQQYHA